MKKMFLLPAVLVASGLAVAQEVGRVISSTPIIQQVGVPRHVCSTEQMVVQPSRSGAGAVMGAIAGGAMGNAVGGGSGRAAATMIGIIGGAVIGDRVEGGPQAQVQNMQRCGTQTFYENRLVAYSVVYEYAGKQYTAQLPNDPGPTLLLHISPVDSMDPVGADMSPMTYPQEAYQQPSATYVAPAAYPRFYTQPYYPPFRVQANIWYEGGHRNRHRR